MVVMMLYHEIASSYLVVHYKASAFAFIALRDCQCTTLTLWPKDCTAHGVIIMYQERAVLRDNCVSRLCCEDKPTHAMHLCTHVVICTLHTGQCCFKTVSTMKGLELNCVRTPFTWRSPWLVATATVVCKTGLQRETTAACQLTQCDKVCQSE